MKRQYVSEVGMRARLAPYVLATFLTAIGASLLWVVSRFSCLALGLVSGALLSIFHIMKWRTGREGFQLAAMAAVFVPYFFLMAAHLGFGQIFQFIGVVISVYAGTLVTLRHKLLTWIQP